MSKHPALAFVGRRLLIMLITLAGISIVSFTTVYLLPGDPVASRYPEATEEELAMYRAYMGLDQPLHIQYVRYFRAIIIDGDFGESYNTKTAVREDLRRRLPASVELALSAMLFGILLGVPLGILAAVYRNSVIDHIARLIGIGTISMPAFWVSIVAIYIFFYTLHWAPAPIGRLSLNITPPPVVTGFLTIDSLLARDWDAFSGAWQSLALPICAFGISLVAPLSRITRAAMSEALQEEYITFARAIGVPERDVVMQDAFRGSQVALLTMVGMVVAHLVVGNALIETVFSWPGVGRYAVDAVVTHDMAPINTVLLLLAVGVAFVNLFVDLIYALIDPRIRHGLLG